MKKLFGFLCFLFPLISHADVPQVIEMFTSFNCPACPAADHYAKGIVDGNKALILAYHVDYWNKDGFIDPFSHADFTQRQYDYSSALGTPGKVFTPQMIIDGYKAVKPPLAVTVPLALSAAKENPKQEVKLTKQGEDVVASFPRIDGFDFPVLWLIGYNNSGYTVLDTGIHKGRKALYVNTVMYAAELPYTGEMNITFTPQQIPRTDNIAVFLQEAGPGRILALGTLAL